MDPARRQIAESAVCILLTMFQAYGFPRNSDLCAGVPACSPTTRPRDVRVAYWCVLLNKNWIEVYSTALPCYSSAASATAPVHEGGQALSTATLTALTMLGTQSASLFVTS